MLRPSPTRYRLEFRPVRRAFRRPLVTAHGTWAVRESLLIRLTNTDGGVGYGEAAPVPGFTSETIARDLAWLHRQNPAVTLAALARVPASLACLNWALACARAMSKDAFAPAARAQSFPVAALLPAGRAAVAALARFAAQGYRTFKWKIAAQSPDEEFRVLEKLLSALPRGARLRLDANGGLNAKSFAAWLARLPSLARASAIEFIEQPLPPARSPRASLAQLELAADSPVPIALDESVAGLPALVRAHAARWPGPLVVKPSLLGDLAGFIAWRAREKPDLVYSSAFETSVGLHAALWLASTDPRAGQRALGFGTLDAFRRDGLQLRAHAPGPKITSAALTVGDFAQLWNRLPPSD
jgi:O-succinylbenzoate synthase